VGDGAEVDILNILDDHSHLCWATDARRIPKGGDVVASFRKAFKPGNSGRRFDRHSSLVMPEDPSIVRPAV
jgi:hypothetical protein